MTTKLTPVTATRDGVDFTDLAEAAASAGNEWANTGQEFVMIANASGSPVTVTMDIKPTVDGLAVTDRTLSVADGATAIFGPFPPAIYNSNGLAKITYNDATSVTVLVVKCPPG